MDAPATKPPAAWRGVHARRGDSTQAAHAGINARPSFVDRLRREIHDHPAETVALVAMGIAAARLLKGREEASVVNARPSRRKRIILPMSLMAAVCMLALSGCATESGRVVHVEPDTATFGREVGYDLIESGRAIAQRECASCHAIDYMTVSPDPRAPPLSKVLSHRDSDALADDLVAGVHVRTKAMPTFDFNVVAADALAAYLESIQR